MTGLVILHAAHPPRRDDADEVSEAKAVTAAAAWCELLRARGERVTFGGLLPAPARRRKTGAA